MSLVDRIETRPIAALASVVFAGGTIMASLLTYIYVNDQNRTEEAIVRLSKQDQANREQMDRLTDIQHGIDRSVAVLSQIAGDHAEDIKDNEAAIDDLRRDFGDIVRGR